ncbi:MAG: hypothetical protein HFJ11_05750 [Bacilli bacterium]|nr:hypothetical protein [Bacilli bacterium]
MSKIQDNYKQLEDEDETLDLLLEKYKIDYGFIGSIKNFFNKNKNYFIDRKHNRTVLKNEIKKQKKLVKELDRKSENASKFSFKEIMSFFAEIISIYEREEYKYGVIYLENIIIQPLVMEMYPIVINNSIGVVARSEVFTKARKREFKNKSDFIRFLGFSSEKNIVLNKEDKIDLLKDDKLIQNLILSFPYLDGICYDIVAMKFDNLEMSDEEIFKLYLSTLNEQSRKEKVKK